MAKKYREFRVEEGDHPKNNKRFPKVYFPQVQIMPDGEWLGIKPKRKSDTQELSYSFISAEEGTYSLNKEGADNTIKEVKNLKL